MDHKATPILELRGLGKDFTSGGMFGSTVTRALDGIDLRIEPGESLGIVGESGSGKTTLARCALFLLEPTSGRVLFDGADLATMDGRELRRRRGAFQIIFQDALASMDPRMTVFRLLLEPFETHGIGTRAERRAWIYDLLRSVSLDDTLVDRYPDELSGGQQQRVVIARALALKPRLLVADEPVASLDPSVQAQVLNLLADLRQRFGLTLVLISHSLPVVRLLCDRIMVLYRGRIVEESPADLFFERPCHPYSRLLLASIPGERLDGGPAADAVNFRPPSVGCPFRPRCPQALPVCGSTAPKLGECKPGLKVSCFLYSNRTP